MKERPARRDIAKARCHKGAAVFIPVAQIGPLGTAEAKVIPLRVGIRRNLAIARHPQSGKTIVGELRRRAVCAARGDVAPRAIAFFRIGEQS